MLKQFQKHKARYALVFLLVLALAAVRVFERKLFYDPFLHYFEGDYLTKPYPNYDGWLLALSLAARYGLNTVLSLLIIYVLFRSKDAVRFAGILCLVLFVLLMAGFFLLLESGPSNNFLLFYLRRFLIQPLLVLLFVPAFYYQQLMLKNNSL